MPACGFFAADDTVTEEVRRFGTTTSALLALADWLAAAGVPIVALEGVYWKPVSNVLEGHYTDFTDHAQALTKTLCQQTEQQALEQHVPLRHLTAPTSTRKKSPWPWPKSTAAPPAASRF